MEKETRRIDTFNTSLLLLIIFGLLVWIFSMHMSKLRLENGFEITDLGVIVSGDKEAYGLLDIPKEIRGVPVKGIGESAFEGVPIEYLSFPDGLEMVDDRAFKDCGLKDVVFNSNLVYIGEEAFKGNRLSYITLPDSVRKLNKGSFQDNRLRLVVFGENVSSIADECLMGNRLRNVSVNSQMVEIGARGLADNPGLQYLDLKDVEILGENFADSKVLEEVRLGSKVQFNGSESERVRELFDRYSGEEGRYIYFWETWGYIKDKTAGGE